jgi:two-component system sensor histidine kinase UhpB
MKQTQQRPGATLDSLDCFTDFCDAWPDPVLLKLDSRTCRVNGPFKNCFGLNGGLRRYDAEELLASLAPTYGRLVGKVWRRLGAGPQAVPAPDKKKTFFLKERTGPDSAFCARVSVFGVPAGGRLLACAVIQDLSDFSNLKLRYRHTETRYKKLVEMSGDIIYVHDQGRIVFINTTGARLLGASSPGQVLGRTFIDFVHPDYREVVLKRFRALTRDKREVRGAENKIVRLDGSVIDVQVFGTSCRYRDKPAVQVMLRDISKRKTTEQELKTTYQELRNLLNSIQTLREKERMSISREIHDELGNALTVLKYDVTWLLNRLPANSSATGAKGRDVLARIDGIIGKVRKISTALRPGILDNLGIGAAVEWQAREFQKLSGIRCEVLLKPPAMVLDKELATTIFRIFQETLTNVLRHAQATRCRVELMELRKTVVLKVFDDGRGVKNKEIHDPTSIGFIGIRERVEHWGGRMKIHGVAGKGSAVLIAVPLPEKKRTPT